MGMIFREITAYPPEDWVSLIGGIINRSTGQVDIFFGNTRQKRARLHRDSSSAKGQPEHVQDCVEVTLPFKERPVKMRKGALELYPAEEWTDALLEEITMIYSFRASMLLHTGEELIDSDC